MNPIFRKSLSRRTVLKGGGVTVGLPLLDAMIPGLSHKAWAATQTPKFLYIQFPHGTRADSSRTPNHWNFDQNLSVLKPHVQASRVSLLVGLDHGAGGDPHNGSLVLTGDLLRKSDSSRPSHISFDQFLADRLPGAQQTPRKSLALGVRGRGGGGLPYRRSISWRPGGVNLPKYSDPAQVFGFIGGVSDQPQVDRAYLSLLDRVQESYRDLKAQLSVVDAKELDYYFETIRELERQAKAVPPSVPFTYDNTKASADVNSLTGFELRSELILDMAVVALQNGTTDVVTIQLDEGGNGSRDGLGFGGHTWHDGDSPGGDMHSGHKNVNEQYDPVQRVLARIYKRGVDALLDRNLWNQSAYMMTSEAGHHHHNSGVEVMISGGVFSGQLGHPSKNMQNQHSNRLLVDVAQRMGLNVSTFSKANSRINW